MYKLIFLLIFKSINLFAEISIPSYDLTRPSINSAALSWQRDKFKFGGNYGMLSGERKIENTTDLDIKSNLVDAIVGFKYKDFSLEIYFKKEYDKNIIEQSSSSVFSFWGEGTLYQFLFAYKILPNISIGIDYISNKNKYSTIEKNQGKLGVGSSISFFKYLFLGLNFKYIQSEESYKKDIKWVESFVGLTFHTSPHDTKDDLIKFQIGIAYQRNPETIGLGNESSGEGSQFKNSSNQFTYYGEVRLSLLKFGSNFVNYITLGISKTDKYEQEIGSTSKQESNTLKLFLLTSLFKDQLYFGIDYLKEEKVIGIQKYNNYLTRFKAAISFE